MATAPHPAGAEPPTDVMSDADLITATRGGDTKAYGELYARHKDAANRLARILARDGAEADDLVSEAFAKILNTLRGGGGPDLAFRAYLLTTLRHTFYDRTRKDKRVEFTDDMTRHDRGETFEDPAVAGLERRYAARAFKRLPERWQVVLWHTEVEGESPKDVAKLLGLTPNGVSALAYRARERLREGFLQEHAADTVAGDCRWTADRLGARVREGLSARDSQKVDAHLGDCDACRLLFVELGELNQGIPAILAPVVLAGSATAYLAAAGVKLAAVGAGIGGALGGAWSWVLRGVNKIRQAVQQLGGKGAAVGGGIVAVAAVMALILVANETPPEQPVAEPPPESVVEPPPGEEPPPEEEEEEEPEEEAPEEPPAEEDEPEAPADEETPPASAPKDLEISTPEVGTDLVAGDSGVLPITVRAPENAANADGEASEQESEAADEPVDLPLPDAGDLDPSGDGPVEELVPDLPGLNFAVAPEKVTLTATVPKGVTLAAEDAGDKWRCTGEAHTITCSRPAMKPGTKSTAKLRLDIPEEVSGFQTVAVKVRAENQDGDAELRVAIAPRGMSTAFASTSASGVAIVGNTLMTCKPYPSCLHGPLLDNHTRMMTGYDGDDSRTVRDGVEANSGATLKLPGGAKVVWAGLYWTASDWEVPGSVTLSRGGERYTVSADQVYSASERPVTQAVAEVTGLIGSGTWTVAADADRLPRGVMNYAGWSLVVAYDTGADREVGVYEGLAQPRGHDATTLQIPHRGETTVGFVLWDGDRTLKGDCATLGGSAVGHDGNLGSSHAQGSGEDHTFGVDAATYKLTVPPSQETLSVTTGADPLDIGVIASAATPPS